MTSSSAAEPFLALGMVSAPHNFERRRSVRRDMLDLASVRTGVLIFRFLLGHVLPKARFVFGSLGEFHNETARFSDMLMLDTLDGPGPNKQCSCLEKTVSWFQYAVRQWPIATFYGKTEDDAYVQLRSLELELRRLQTEGRRYLVYGSMNLCAMPSRPQPDVGYQGSWLGRLENFKNAQAVRRGVRHLLRRCAATMEASLPSVQSSAHGCGVPLPFATGDLQVMDASLSRALFGRCSYLRAFVETGRAANRQSSCMAKGNASFASSWATLTCDCAFGRLLSECGRELSIRPTLVHMTQTKSHNYAPNAGYTLASAPSRLSIVVHGLKAHDTWKTGPNRTAGGAWGHTHETASHWRRRGEDDAGFPPLLWSYDPAAPSNGTVLQPVDSRRQAWYAAVCHPRRSVLKRRVEALVASVKGPRPHGAAEHDFLGGQPVHWFGHGCHPSRGFAYPRFPDLIAPLREQEIAPAAEYRVTAFAAGNLAFDWDAKQSVSLSVRT